MKTILALILTLVGTQSFAATYQCRDIESGNLAQLKIDTSNVFWSEQFHSATSTGLNIGVEEAPHSEPLGFQLFRLTDFYMTEDSANVLALSPDLLKLNPVGRAVTYFDNDGYEEEVTNYNCQRVQ